MDPTTHWENVHATKKPNEVGWYRPHLDQFGARFELAGHVVEERRTPWGSAQQFVCCYCLLTAR